MLSKILAFLLTFAINAVAGIAILILMLVAMNGYSESDAQWGLIAYVVLAAAVSIAASFGAVVANAALVRRQFSTLLALLIAVPALSILAVVLEIIASLAGVGVAEYVRLNH